MATNHTAAAAPFGAITTHRIVTAVVGVADRVRMWNDTRRTVSALRALSPDQLDDIGLTTADVDSFGRKGL